ncbi:hypothetical protein FKP32DRAFT_1681575 [Trametes sanguinea]|nr:hypothetical protein FKP32DRAFT_1681575 [Trametes sanguinea]
MDATGMDGTELNHHALGTSTVYHHITLDNVVYMTVFGGKRSSPWIYVSVVVAEIRQPSPGNQSQWMFGIHPPLTHSPITIDMMSDYWSLQWDEVGVFVAHDRKASF